MGLSSGSLGRSILNLELAELWKPRGRVDIFVMVKCKGTREARLPTKVLWVRRMRVLGRLLHKFG